MIKIVADGGYKEGQYIVTIRSTGTPDFFVFECPIETISELIKLHEPYDVVNWFPYVALNYNGTEYYGRNNSITGNLYNLSGDYNRIKVIKNEGADHYTLEFAVTLNGKRLEGNYTGTFIRD